MLLVQIRDEVNAASSTKELFTSAQVHIFNKLKKEAFTRKYFISDPFAAYLDKLALAGTSSNLVLVLTTQNISF